MKKILTGLEALEKLKIGSQKLCDCVSITLGPKGKNVALNRKYTTPLVTNDGVTIAKEVELEDHFENMGVNIIKEASVRANNNAGDGTTTACLLANAIVQEGFKSISAGYNPIFIRQGIEKATNECVKLLRELSKPISNEQEMKQVASVSAGNINIGEIIGEAINEVGTDGIITIEESSTSETYITKSQGYEYDRGLASPYMATDTTKMQAVLENPYILIVNKKISSINELLPILEQLMQTGKQLLIIADDIENEVLGTLVVNKINGNLPVTFTKAPAFAERRRLMLEDICALTGAKMVSDNMGLLLQNINLEDLGSARQVIISSEKTTIIEGNGSKERLNNYIEMLKKQIQNENEDYKKELLKTRLGKLTCGVAVIHAGAKSEVECKELKLRIEDALSATKAAAEEGIVAGGGVTLLYLSTLLSDFPETLQNDDEKIGAKILLTAIKEPIKQIAINSGVEPGKIMHEIETRHQANYGYNATNGDFIDMFEAGIIDPVKVTRSALENASSVASTLLTTSALITEIEIK